MVDDREDDYMEIADHVYETEATITQNIEQKPVLKKAATHKPPARVVSLEEVHAMLDAKDPQLRKNLEQYLPGNVTEERWPMAGLGR